MNVILLILIILLALRLLFQWLVPLVLPYMLKRFIKRQGGNFGQMNYPGQEDPISPPKFEKRNDTRKSSDDEYIDFEEIK